MVLLDHLLNRLHFALRLGALLEELQLSLHLGLHFLAEHVLFSKKYSGRKAMPHLLADSLDTLLLIDCSDLPMNDEW